MKQFLRKISERLDRNLKTTHYPSGRTTFKDSLAIGKILFPSERNPKVIEQKMINLYSNYKSSLKSAERKIKAEKLRELLRWTKRTKKDFQKKTVCIFENKVIENGIIKCKGIIKSTRARAVGAGARMIANTPVKDKTCNKTIDLLDLLFEKNLQYTWFRGKQIKDILQHMILQPEQYAFGDIKKSGIIRSTKCQNCGKLLEFKFIPKL